jgi:Ca2+-binding RTX toxin-like protein
MVKRKGTNKSETLVGTNDADAFISLGGSDTLNGLGGADRFSAGDGNDTVFGGAGNDVIYGHSNADRDPSSGFIRSTKIADVGYVGVQTALAGGDDGFFYALNKSTGEIFRINDETGNKTTFLDIPPGEFAAEDEEGVLGMAFHPNYENNGRFFVYLTNADGDIEIREYGRESGNPPTSDAAQFEVVMTIPHPDFGNHNGGSIVFGPDGYLYLGIGDGGGNGDPGQNAQDKDSLLGKILRIDIDGDDFPSNEGKNYAIPNDNPFVGETGADEIWALGVRNPWRIFFDPKTGDLYIADVGQNKQEEINVIKAGTDGGLNFGWNYREGDIKYDSENSPGDPPNGLEFTDPVFTYDHKGDNASVTGGVVLHKPGQGLDGAYIFSDFITGKFYSFRMVDGKIKDSAERSDQIRGDALSSITSYGTDSDGNVLAINIAGEVFRLKFGDAAGDGGDKLHGGEGDDKLFGGVGRDKLFGDSGRDILNGGIGNDVLTGGADSDRFVFHTGSGKDDIIGFDAEGGDHDVIDLRAMNAIEDFDDLAANHMVQQGNDVLISAGSDEILIKKVQLSDLDNADFDF